MITSHNDVCTWSWRRKQAKEGDASPTAGVQAVVGVRAALEELCHSFFQNRRAGHQYVVSKEFTLQPMCLFAQEFADVPGNRSQIRLDAPKSHHLGREA